MHGGKHAVKILLMDHYELLSLCFVMAILLLCAELRKGDQKPDLMVRKLIGATRSIQTGFTLTALPS